MFGDIKFLHPEYFVALILIPAMILYYYFIEKKKTPSIFFSRVNMLKNKKPSIKVRLIETPLLLRIIAIIALIVALARPQSFSMGENVFTEGIDIGIVLDISGSMLAEDFKPNRLEAAKKITSDFVSQRVSDQIGLVIFAREAFTQCPLTIDYSVLKTLLNEVKSGMVEDGTAIGNAIANGINRLKDSKAKSKVIILLTDGVNNSGEIDPRTAAEIARTYNIRIYTIGIGTIGNAPYPFQTPFGIRYQMVPVEIDEPLLKFIAEETGGKYFRATDNKKLEKIYEEIDKLEKTKVEVTSYRSTTDHYFPWLVVGLFSLFFELIFRKTIFRRLP